MNVRTKALIKVHQINQEVIICHQLVQQKLVEARKFVVVFLLGMKRTGNGRHMQNHKQNGGTALLRVKSCSKDECQDKKLSSKFIK